MIPVDDGRCFACGPENRIGLQLVFEEAGEGAVRARTQLRADFAGWQGIAHGGIALALLDEAMAYAAGSVGFRGVTASMNTRFRRPVPLETPIEIHGRVEWVRRNVLQLTARVTDAEGAVLAQADGRFVAQGRIADVADRRNPLSA